MQHLAPFALPTRTETVATSPSLSASAAGTSGNDFSLRASRAGPAKRGNASAVVAQIRQFETGPNGQKVTIEYWPADQPGSANEIDALVLAEQCERDWRALLAANGIPVRSH